MVRAITRLVLKLGEGAAHEKALNRFTLNTPEPGVLSCEGTESSNAISIELLADNNYRVGDQTGRYESSSVLSGESSELLFATGPLQGTESRYKEDANSGQQVLQIRKSTSKAFYLTGSSTSSSSVTTECTRQSEPKPYKLYGPENAPERMEPITSTSVNRGMCILGCRCQVVPIVRQHARMACPCASNINSTEPIYPLSALGGR